MQPSRERAQVKQMARSLSITPWPPFSVVMKCLLVKSYIPMLKDVAKEHPLQPRRRSKF